MNRRPLIQNKSFKPKRYYLLILLGIIAVLLTGCKDLAGNNHLPFISSHVVSPFYGTKDKYFQDENSNNIHWTSADSDNIVNVWYPENPYDKNEKPKDNTLFSYFQYAEGIPIPANKVGEGVDTTIDQYYKGQKNKIITTDSLPDEMLVPLAKPGTGVILSDGPGGGSEYVPSPPGGAGGTGGYIPDLPDFNESEEQNPEPSECYGFLPGKPEWTTSGPKTVVDTRDGKFSDNYVIDNIKKAMDVWDGEITSSGGPDVFNSVEKGTVANRVNTSGMMVTNGVNDIWFAYEDSNVIAATWTAYSSGQIFEFDMYFNTKYFGKNTNSDIDFFSIALHELGHSVGLGHPSAITQCINEVMFPTYQHSHSSLQSGEKKGINVLYTPAAPSTAQIINDLVYGFSSQILPQEAYAMMRNGAVPTAHITNPNQNRWGADPEIFVLKKDYLDLFNINKFDYSKPINITNLPAVIFVLYDSPHSSNYFKVDAQERDYSSKPLYFDAYYSVEIWNAQNNAPAQLPLFAQYMKKDTRADDEGFCKYTLRREITPDNFTILQKGINISSTNPKIPNGSDTGPPSGTDSSFINPSGDENNGDVKFTLIDSIGKSGTDDKITQKSINLWTKWEFIEMLGNGSYSFIPDRQENEQFQNKDLSQLEKFVLPLDFQVPVELYSKAAYQRAKDTPYSYPYDGCKGALDEEACAYEASYYKVKFIPQLSDSTIVKYHNRIAIYNKNIYAKQDKNSGFEGAHPVPDLPKITDWLWCWFSPQ